MDTQHHDKQDGINDEPYITIQELAERLNITVRTARNWQTNKIIIPAIKIGRIVKYKYSETIERLEYLSETKNLRDKAKKAKEGKRK